MLMRKKTTVIFDIDGTLANSSHRLHHIQKTPKDWPAFLSACDQDTPNEWCFAMLHALDRSGIDFLFLTGRSEEWRGVTLDWLQKHVNGYQRYELDDRLLMRPTASAHRPDTDVKREIYQRLIAPRHQVLFVVEDRSRVVKMWRELGLVCLQCDDWEDTEAGQKHIGELTAHFQKQEEG